MIHVGLSLLGRKRLENSDDFSSFIDDINSDDFSFFSDDNNLFNDDICQISDDISYFSDDFSYFIIITKSNPNSVDARVNAQKTKTTITPAARPAKIINSHVRH